MDEFPNLTAALRDVVPALLIDCWQNLAAEHRATGEYASSLSFSTLFPYGGDPLTVAVANTARHARWLEEGRDGFHLPSVMDWSRPSVRTTKDGRRYIVIPFRHRTPGRTGVSSTGARTMMPQAVVTAMRAKRAARQARLAALGGQQSKVYDERLYPNASARTKDVIRELRRRVQEVNGSPLPGVGGYTWSHGPYEGMIKRTQTNPDTGRSSSVYSTLRVMFEDSNGFFIPPMPGYHFARRAIAASRAHIVEVLAEAGRDDFVELLEADIREVAVA